MTTRTIILASLSLLLALPSAWAGPKTPEQAWRQMQGGSQRRITLPRTNRPLYRTPQVKRPLVRTKTKTNTTVVQPKQKPQIPAAKKPVKKPGQGWLSKLKSKFKRSNEPKVKEKAQSTDVADVQQARSHKVGRAMGLARVKLTSLWSGLVGGINNIIAAHRQRREIRDAAFNALYWRQPMIIPAGSPIPAEVLIGGMRLHKLQNLSQGTLTNLYRSGMVTAAEYRIITEARMGLPQMMQMQQGAPAPEGGQTAAPQPEQPTMPPPPQQQQQQQMQGAAQQLQ